MITKTKNVYRIYIEDYGNEYESDLVYLCENCVRRRVEFGDKVVKLIPKKDGECECNGCDHGHIFFHEL